MAQSELVACSVKRLDLNVQNIQKVYMLSKQRTIIMKPEHGMQIYPIVGENLQMEL